MNEFTLSAEHALIALNDHAIVSVTDRTGRIIFVNDKFCEISGYSREELIGENHRILKSGAHSEALYKTLWHTISSGKTWKGTICNLGKHGDLYWVETTITPVTDQTSAISHYVSVRTDVTSLVASQHALEYERKLLNAASQAGKITIFEEDVETGICRYLDGSNSQKPVFSKRDWVSKYVPLSGLRALSEAQDERKLVVKLPLLDDLQQEYIWHTLQIVDEFRDRDGGFSPNVASTPRT